MHALDVMLSVWVAVAAVSILATIILARVLMRDARAAADLHAPAPAPVRAEPSGTARPMRGSAHGGAWLSFSACTSLASRRLTILPFLSRRLKHGLALG